MNRYADFYSFVYSTKMTIALRLHEAMHQAGIKSQNELARRAGVPQPTINRILRGDGGKQGPATQTLKKLAAACQVSFQWLGDGTDAEQGTGKTDIDLLSQPEAAIEDLFVVPKSSRAIKSVSTNLVRVSKVRLRPHVASAAAVAWGEENAAGEVYLAKDWLQARGYDERRLIAFSIIEESMAPTLHVGDIVAVNLADRQPRDGEVFVLAYEGMVLIRRFMRNLGCWWLCADSADQRRFQRKQYATNECTVIGRVIYRLSERI